MPEKFDNGNEAHEANTNRKWKISVYLVLMILK
jgi:hypothetical protein